MKVSVSGVEVLDLLRWGKEKEVQTKRGPRLLSKAKPKQGDPFWELWRSDPGPLKAVGVSVSRDQKTGEWEVCRWRQLDAETLRRRAESLAASTAVDADLVVPAPAGCALMPFQRAGVAVMASRPNNFLGDEMGLGKTVQALGLINLLPDVHRVLVVTKNTLKTNWFNECKKWLVRPMSVGIADASCFPSTDVVIANYDVMHKFQKKCEFYWDLVVLDEAHYIKNPKARRSKAIVGYRPTKAEAEAGMEPVSGIPARRKLAMTGTPFENRPAELWTILSWLLGPDMMSKGAFERRFCDGKMTGFGWAADGASHLDELNRWLRENVMVRRLKRDVLRELPPKTRMVVELDHAGAAAAVTDERRVCEKYEADLLAAQAQRELIKCVESDEDYERQRAELNRQFMVPFHELARVRHQTALAKLPAAVEALRDDLDEQSSRKALVFAHHADVLAAAHREFPGSVLVTGETPLKERDLAVRRFQEDPACGPFFGSIRATGEGLTLTAAWLVVFFEEDWVPGKLTQCEDRAHRIGQRDNVLVKHYVLRGTMDAKMVATTVRKQDVLDQALDDGDRREMATEPVVVPRHEPLATRKGIRVEASIVTAAQRTACLEAVRAFAAELGGSDAVGVVDLQLAEALSARASLTAREAVLARKLCQRYVGRFTRDLADCGAAPVAGIFGAAGNIFVDKEAGLV